MMDPFGRGFQDLVVDRAKKDRTTSGRFRGAIAKLAILDCASNTGVGGGAEALLSEHDGVPRRGRHAFLERLGA